MINLKMTDPVWRMEFNFGGDKTAVFVQSLDDDTKWKMTVYTRWTRGATEAVLEQNNMSLEDVKNTISDFLIPFLRPTVD